MNMNMNIIKLKNINVDAKNKNWKNFSILKNISFEISKWEVFAFIGPNGAGKSTTIRTILWLQKTTSWKTMFFWKETLENSKHKIGYAPDEAIFYEYLTATEHLKFFSRLWWQKLSNKQSDDLLNLVWLHHKKDLYIKDYSKWMKQRLGLAISLTNDPELLIRDEPMNGLDPIGRKQIKTLIKTLQGQGKTIFFSTHILTDVEALANRFGIIHNWQLLCQKPITELSKPLEEFFIEQISKQ